MDENKGLLVCINGDMVPIEEAKISVFDRSFTYGDGVFEGIQILEGRILNLDKHIERLYRSAKYVKIEIPISQPEMRDAIFRLVKECNSEELLENGYLRPIITRGQGSYGLDRIRDLGRPNIVIVPQIRSGYYDDNLRLKKGLVGKVVSTRRTPPECMDPRVKTCNYLNNVLGKLEQFEAGADVGIMLDTQGFVCEECGRNIFMVKDMVFYTPLAAKVLEGIVRGNIIEIARGKGWGVVEKDLTLYDLYNADEVFVCATMTDVMPVVKVDGRTIGSGKPGPVLKEMLGLLRQKARDESPKVL